MVNTRPDKEGIRQIKVGLVGTYGVGFRWVLLMVCRGLMHVANSIMKKMEAGRIISIISETPGAGGYGGETVKGQATSRHGTHRVHSPHHAASKKKNRSDYSLLP